MGRTTTTAAVTRMASGAGRSSRGSRRASTRSTKPLRGLRLLSNELYRGYSTDSLLRSLTDDLRRQRSEIMRGTFAVPFDRGLAIVNLTKSERVMLRSFYSAVL